MQGNAGRPGSDEGRQDLPGLSRACRALAGGMAAVVPNPAPMTYGIVATDPRTVNALKGRPLDQNVGVSLHDRSHWRQVAPGIDLSPAHLDAVAAMLERRLTLLLPLRRDVPAPSWAAPAIRDGNLAAFNGYWTATARLWERFPRLYGSSANVTGEPPADCAARAVAMFGAGCAVIDADALGDPRVTRSASTMVRIDRAGRLHLHRAGAHDAAHGLGPAEFLRQLAASVGLPDLAG